MKKEKRIVVPDEPRTRLTPVDVQQQQFRRSFRGYDEQEVDDFLDRVTEDIGALLEENERLKDQERRAPTTPLEGAAEAAEASRVVADIKRAAREEADAIVREARAEADAVAKGAEPRLGGGADDSGHLSRFVTRERGFLQDLAGLIQSHAETVKQLVHEARRAEASAPTASEEKRVPETEVPSFPSPPSFVPPRPAVVGTERSREPFGPAGVSAGRDIDETADVQAAAAGTADAEEDVTTGPRGAGILGRTGDEEVPPRPIIEVPDADSPAAVTLGEPEEQEVAVRERRGRDRDSSLSELFWGED